MHTSDNFSLLLEPRFRKIFYDGYAEISPQYPDVFNIKTSKKAQEHDYRVSGTGEWTLKEPGAAIDEDHADTGAEATYTHASYAKMITIERELADDEMYGVMDKLPKQLGRGGRELVERISANVLNNSFTVAGYDDVSLINSSHTTISGATIDNTIPAAALADATLKAALTDFRKSFRTEAGLKMQAKANNIVTGADLDWTVATLMRSVNIVGSDYNDKNVLPKLKHSSLDYITSTTAWWLFDSNLNELNFFWRVKPEFAKTAVFDNMIAKYRGYLRFSVGYSDYKGWMASQGA